MRTSTEAFMTCSSAINRTYAKNLAMHKRRTQCVTNDTTRPANCSATYRPQHAAVLSDGAEAAEDGEEEYETAADEDHVDGDGVEVGTDDERQKRAIDGHPYSDT